MTDPAPDTARPQDHVDPPALAAPATGEDIIASRWPYNVHALKTVPPYFQHVASFDKTFEVRRADRDFQPGDLLVLREWTGEAYTDRKVLRKITYVLRDGEQFGVQSGFVVLGLHHVTAADWSGALEAEGA